MNNLNMVDWLNHYSGLVETILTVLGGIVGSLITFFIQKNGEEKKISQVKKELEIKEQQLRVLQEQTEVQRKQLSLIQVREEIPHWTINLSQGTTYTLYSENAFTALNVTITYDGIDLGQGLTIQLGDFTAGSSKSFELRAAAIWGGLSSNDVTISWTIEENPIVQEQTITLPPRPRKS